MAKIDTNVLPRLEDIAEWIGQGIPEAVCAKRCGVAESTWREAKKTYPTLATAIKRGRATADAAVVSAVYRRAIGYQATETRRETGVGPNGPVERIITTTRDVAPDTTAQIWWLKNRDPQHWRDRHDLQVAGDLVVNVIPQGSRPGLPGAVVWSPPQLSAADRRALPAGEQGAEGSVPAGAVPAWRDDSGGVPAAARADVATATPAASRVARIHKDARDPHPPPADQGPTY